MFTPAFRPMQFTVSVDGDVSISLNPASATVVGRYPSGAGTVREPAGDQTLLILEHSVGSQAVEDRYRIGSRGGIGACLNGGFQAVFSSDVIRISLPGNTGEIQVFDARNGRKCPFPVGVEYVQDSALKSTFNGPLLAPALENSVPSADEVRDENGFARAERRLRDRLSNRVVDISTCSPGVNEEKAGIAAALNCATRSEGPVRRPLIISFETAAGYNAFVRMRRAVVLETGNCGSGGSHNGSWSRRGKLMGTLMCYPGDSRYRIFWTYDSARVAVYASAVDTPNSRKILFDWWQRSVSIFG